MEKQTGNKKFLEKEFVHINSRECTLLLEFNESGYSYSILHDNTNELLFSDTSNTFLDFFNSTENQIREIFKNDILFKYSFKTVLILINNFYSTLVPIEFYEKGKDKELLSFNAELPKTNLKFLSDKIPNIAYYNIYINTKVLNKVLKEFFVNFYIKSSKSIILDYMWKITKTGEILHLHITKSFIFCSYFLKGKLEFSNSYKYSNEEEIVFNVLNIYNQLGLNNERTVLYLSGFISKKDKKYDLLYTYIRNIEFLKRPLKINYNHRVKIIPEHYFLQHFIALL